MMKQKKWLPFIILALALAGCMFDNDDDDDHKDNESALVADVCNHLLNVPFDSLEAKEAEPYEEIHGELAHKTWRLSLLTDGDKYKGTFVLHPEEGNHDHDPTSKIAATSESLEVTLFATAEATFEIKKEDTVLSPEDETLDISGCSLIKFQSTYELEVGTQYSLSVSESGSENILIIFGEHGGEHHH
jgi:hypothetical protein